MCCSYLYVIKADVGGDGLGQQRHQRPLLQLVEKDGRVGLAGSAHGESGGRVTRFCQFRHEI